MEEIEFILKILREEFLSDQEKIRMKNELVAHIRERPLPLRGRLSIRHIFIPRGSISVPRVAAAACALVLLLSTGTSYAAEGALPGDLLYPVKVSVNEPLEGLMATSPTAKAEWSADLLDRRLSEAETLAAQGRLSTPTRAIVEAQIQKSVANVSASVAALDTASDTVAVASVQSDVEASLVAHESILASLSDNIPAVAQEIAPILATVHVEAAAAHDAREVAERKVLTQHENTGAIATIAQDTKQTADTKLDTVRTLVGAAIHADDASTTAIAASSSAGAIQAAINAGNQELKTGNYGEAFGTFQAAARAAEAVSVHLDATVRLSGLLGGHVHDATSTTTSTATSAATTSESNVPALDVRLLDSSN